MNGIAYCMAYAAVVLVTIAICLVIKGLLLALGAKLVFG